MKARDGGTNHRGNYAENADFWIKIIREGLDPYRTRLTDSVVLTALGECQGKDILDAGCGEGYLSREIARRGGVVTGVDVTEPLVEAASRAAELEGLPIVHCVADLAQIPFEDESFDSVVCNHVVADLEDLEGSLAEIARVLRPAGRVVIMMLHPCFYGARSENSGQRRMLSAGEYFETRTFEQEFVVSGITSRARVKIWMRPMEAYISALVNNGLYIEDLREPHPPLEEVRSDSWWRENFVRPLFMSIVARKPL